MDAAFIALSVAVGGAFAWLPLRDRICAHRGHRLGGERLRQTYEDGTYETERVCMCRQETAVTIGRVFHAGKEIEWDAPASATMPATSP